nr:hypothetical protein [Cellulomonas sp. P24]
MPAVLGAPVTDPLTGARQQDQQRPVTRGWRRVDQSLHVRRVQIAWQLAGLAPTQLSATTYRCIAATRAPVPWTDSRGLRHRADPVSPGALTRLGVAVDQVAEERPQHAQPMVHRAGRAPSIGTPGLLGRQLDDRRALLAWRSPAGAVAAGERIDVDLHICTGDTLQRLLTLSEPATEVLHAQSVRAGRVRPAAPAGQMLQELLDNLCRYTELDGHDRSYSTPDATNNPASTGTSDQDHEISREDLTQTDGHPLPDVAPELLRGPAPEHLWDHLSRLVDADGFRLERGPCGGANGYTSYGQRVVRVRDDVDPAQAVKTLAHELGHIRADHEHRFPDYAINHQCRGQAEVEAESIAYLVTASASLESAAYSVPYVTGWADGDASRLREAASRAIAAAGRIIESGAEQGDYTLDQPHSGPIKSEPIPGAPADSDAVALTR